MKRKKYYLIDNFAQEVIEFSKLKDLIQYAKSSKWKYKRCFMRNNWYYLDNAY